MVCRKGPHRIGVGGGSYFDLLPTEVEAFAKLLRAPWPEAMTTKRAITGRVQLGSPVWVALQFEAAPLRQWQHSVSVAHGRDVQRLPGLEVIVARALAVALAKAV